MKLLFLSLFALVAAIAVGSIAGSDTGYVLLTISGWKIQTSATLFVIIVFLAFLTSYFVIRSAVRFWTMPKEIKKWRSHRNQRRAEKYLTQGLQHMTEGEWKKAEKEFCKAAPYSRAPHVNYLYAARAAQELNSVDRRDEYLTLAYHHNPDADVAVGITQAELQLNQQQTEQALATLKHLQHKQPNQLQVKQLLLNTYTDLNDWQSVLKLIPTIEKTSLLTREEIQAKQLEAYAGLLKEAGKLNDKEKLNEVWRSISRKLQQHFYLMEVYITERLKFEHTADCEVLLRSAIKRQWDVALVRLYGLVVGSDVNKQLSTAETWLQNHARDAVLLLSLGRICMRNELWGKARDYLQESIDVQANPEAYYEFAKFHEHEGRNDAAAECYEKGLALVTGTI